MSLFECKKPSYTAWKVVGGVALAALAVGLLVNLPDLKRYIRISTM